MSTTILLIMGHDRRLSLLGHLEGNGISVLTASDFAEAQRILQARPPVQAVVTDEALSDGIWADVLQEVRGNDIPAETIVCTRLGDARLWIDVLEQGAYDLLVEPYGPDEVRRVIRNAVTRNRAQRQASAA
jgi:DNA-binding NtrC family response regulator